MSPWPEEVLKLIEGAIPYVSSQNTLRKIAGTSRDKAPF